MKTLLILRDVDLTVGRRVVVVYRKGRIYRRVPEAQAGALIYCGAAEVVEQLEPPPAVPVEGAT
jgi:hypothetical protein